MATLDASAQRELNALIVRFTNQVSTLSDFRNRVATANDRLSVRPKNTDGGTTETGGEPCDTLGMFRLALDRNERILKSLEEELSYLNTLV